MRRVVTYIGCLTYMLILMCGCTLRELTYDYHPFYTVPVYVDWTQFEDETPTGMTVMFFPRSGKTPVVELTHSVYSTKVKLRTGMYDVVVFNQSDGEFGSLGFRGMDKYETAEVFVAETESTWYKTKDDDNKLAAQPEPFAIAVYEGFEVTQAMVDLEREEREAAKAEAENRIEKKLSDELKPTISLAPHSVIAKGEVNINVDGIYNLRSVRAKLSGVAENMNISTGIAGQNGATHLLEMWSKEVDEADYTKGMIFTDFTTFGHKGMVLSKAEGSEWEGVMLDVQVLLVDNKTVMDFHFDVSDYITVDGTIGKIVLNINIGRDENSDAPISLPDVKPEGGSEGGFEAEVDNWGDEVDVEVGV